MRKDLNAVALIKEALDKEVKKILTDKIVEEQLDDYEKKLRKKIKPLVESISFDSIESINDQIRFRDELYVYLKWVDEKK